MTDHERTPDPADLATRQEELARISALATSRRPEGPKPTGKCLACGEPVEPGRRWCDADCLSMYNRETEIRRKQGLR